jgi:serine protease
MPLRVLGAGGGTSADINEALRFAAGLVSAGGRTLAEAERPDVVNLSLGCLDCFSATDAAVYAQVRQAGIIVVAAAGNENSSAPGYPASYDGVVSVAAVDLNLQRAPYSNTGPTVDVAAPGGNTGVDLNGDRFADGVLSAAADGNVTLSPPADTRSPGWKFYQGTSMAAPHVAGVVALMKTVCDTLTPAQFDELLASGATTRDLGAAGRDNLFGHGLVDAFAAVQAAEQRCGERPPPGVEVTPVQLDFGTSATSLDVTTRLTGEGALSITGASEDATWITSVAPKAGTTPTNGFGTYTVTVVRDEALAPGRYAATVRFQRSDGGTAEVPVTMQKGAVGGPGDAGFLYVLLLDEQFGGLAQVQGSGAGGSYPFSFGGVPPGTYFIVAGTDSDNDDQICDEGEVCGAWPTLGLPTPLEVGENQPGRDFGVALDLGLGTLRAGDGAPEGGWRKLPAGGTKSFGGGR